MDGNAEKNLNEIGEIKSMKGGGKGKGTPKKVLSNLNNSTDSIFQALYNVLKQPFAKLIFVIAIIIIDGMVFSYYGTPNGFRALVSEGTLALAFVTYFQMKKTENNIVK